MIENKYVYEKKDMFEVFYLTAIAIVIYVFLLFSGFVLTETKWRLSRFEFLNFYPFKCRKCLTFWLIAFFAAIMLVCGQTYIAILEFIFAVMTAIAMVAQEKIEPELTIEEIKKLKEKEND